MTKVELTATQRRLVEAMQAALAGGGWHVVHDPYGVTIRWDSEEKTVAHPERYGWDGPYRSYVFLTLVGGRGGAVVLGVAAAPWTGRRDRTIPYRQAFEMLADPAAAVTS